MTEPIRSAPAFDLYPERWTHGTRHMNKVERCDYMDLLCHQWTDNGLPADPDMLCRLIGYRKGSQIPALVLEKFPVAEDGKRRNRRLEIEREKQHARIARKRDGAAKTNQKRWGGDNAKRPPEASLSDRLATDERVEIESPPPTTHHPPTSPNGDAPSSLPPKASGRGDSKPASRRLNQPDPRHADIMHRWGERFAAVHGFTYVCNGGRDGAALKRFLPTCKDSADDILAVAEAAWCRVKFDQFAKSSKMAVTIVGMCNTWNAIRAELGAHRPTGVSATSQQERDGTLKF